MKLVTSNAHEGIKASVAKVLSATWQRWRIHFMRNALARAGKSGRRVMTLEIVAGLSNNTVITLPDMAS
ncbi:transposase [Novosphingobium sp. AP12]|nr:transposase [Novosphingobium sp. AP12]